METVTDRPSTRFFPENSSELSPQQRRQLIKLAIHEVLKKYVDFSMKEDTAGESHVESQDEGQGPEATEHLVEEGGEAEGGGAKQTKKLTRARGGATGKRGAAARTTRMRVTSATSGRSRGSLRGTARRTAARGAAKVTSTARGTTRRRGFVRARGAARGRGGSHTKATRAAKNETEFEGDRVVSYACEVMTLGLLYLEYCDAIREGDGDRIKRCWKYFMLFFKATGRSNYAVESFTLLAQYYFLFSERMRMQLLWSRTVNVHGRKGKNIPCDMHMEHLNRECKNSLSGLGANIVHDEAVHRVGKSLRSSVEILENFDQVNDLPTLSGHHTTRSSAADFDKLVKQIHTDTKVFTCNPGHSHCNFPTFQRNPIAKLSRAKLYQWCQERFKNLITYH